MASFFWQDADRRWRERYPRWALGWAEWQEGAGFALEGMESGLDMLLAARRSLSPEERLRCPRVFISHKREDVACAIELARIVQAEGMEFWLDVTDPDLRELEARGGELTDRQRALATAMVIEMTLLNSSHVLAAITPNTARSRWVPYEYGRVREDRPISRRSACWQHPDVGTDELSEYLMLGTVAAGRGEVEAWVRWAVNDWEGGAACPEDPWPPARWPSVGMCGEL